MRTIGVRRSWQASRLKALPLLLALGVWSGPAWADAPRDIQGSQRLWLDGFDIGGTDTGNGGGLNPANGAQVTQWKDKSPNGLIAGDAVSYGATAHSFPTYVVGAGVSCNGQSNALEITNGIHPNGSITNTDIFLVTSTYEGKNAFVFSAGLVDGGSNRISSHIPWSDDTIYWDHPIVSGAGRLKASWSGTGSQMNQAYIYNLGASSGLSQILTRDGSNLASSSNSGTYSKSTNHNFYICTGDVRYLQFYAGTISEMIVYNRRLNTAEKNILQSYLAAKHANPGGAGASAKYTAPGNFRYYVGGIGQESDGTLSTGTSAGVTIANSNFLANGRYLLVGVDSLSPATGTVATDAPTGFARRSQRIWYAQRTGGGTGNVTVTFNLAQLGITAKTGDSLALGYRSGTTGAFTALLTVTYGGTGTVSFTASNPLTGYYVLATPAPTAPAISLSLTSAVVSDGVDASNFKMIPGALLHMSAVATNSGDGSPDADTAVLNFPIEPNTKLFVGDLAGAGSGPVQFTQGATSSGLTYTYTSLASQTDRLDFSNDSGATWSYVPTPDTQQADAAITNLRVRLGGTFANGISPNFPSFTLKYGLVVK